MKYKVTNTFLRLIMTIVTVTPRMTGMLNESFTIDRIVVYLATVLV